ENATCCGDGSADVRSSDLAGRAARVAPWAQVLRERRTRLARIKILKGMIKGIETALFKPYSKAAVLKLKAIRKQLIQDARDEAKMRGASCRGKKKRGEQGI